MDLTIVWILFTAWAGICVFYCYRLYQVSRHNRLPIFALPHRYSKTLRQLVRTIYSRIILATIVFIMTVILAYFVKYSS